ncbi:MAG: hypothetical protein NCA08_10550 [Deltaproteobacteria bacterium]|nr:hypothetical protein [Candidatus Deferrimicrobium borealis]
MDLTRAAVAGGGLLLWLLFLPAQGICTEEFSRRTGKECVACHVDPVGGGDGELNDCPGDPSEGVAAVSPAYRDGGPGTHATADGPVSAASRGLGARGM